MRHQSKRHQNKGATGPPSLHLPPEMYAMFNLKHKLEMKRMPRPANKPIPLSGVGHLVELFEQEEPAPRPPFELPKARKERLAREHAEKQRLMLVENIQAWDPHSAKHATTNAFHTLVVARLAFTTEEDTVKRAFEEFGPVKTVRMIKDLNNKSRGYMFVEFENEDDMKRAYKSADGMNIDGRRILVDVERGRTMESWKPRRLGGGLGGTRRGGKQQNDRFAGRKPTYQGGNRRQGGGDRGRRDGGSRYDSHRGPPRDRDGGGYRRDGNRGGSGYGGGDYRDRRHGGGGGGYGRRNRSRDREYSNRGGGGRDRYGGGSRY